MQQRRGGTPTEEPTPRRLNEARRHGRVARSGELSSAVALAAGIGALAVNASGLGEKALAVFRAGIERAVAGNVDGVTATAVLHGALVDSLLIVAPIMGSAAISAGLVGYWQTGGVIALRSLAPTCSRISPWAGMRRLFSKQTQVVLAKSLVKLAGAVALCWYTLAPRVGDIPRISGIGPRAVAGWVAARAFELVVRIGILFVGIGVIDYWWQRRSLRQELMMTRQEARDEAKENEGDPRHRAERQRLHRDLLRHQMVEEIRKASCVIVNPDHLAVALRYDEDTMDAPRIVAKGERLVAQQIKDIARQYGIPIYREVALARALDRLELGDEIPEELYEAVAEVFRFLRRENDT
ncbi:MAG: EscU/YscU/HrcU family type III secretion system export apparatus switch protein [Pseudomonadota bacterium]